jgi:hypothetical protein
MKLFVPFIVLSVAAMAGSFTVTDPYGEPKCPPGVTVGCDVVGTTTLFDFKTGTITIGPTSTTIQIFMDYGPVGATNLAPFAVTASTTISVADIFLYGPGGQIYAIPLFDRTQYGGATAGTVYQANSASALLTSDVVLNNPTDVYYRPGYAVWIDTTQATVASVGTVTLAPGTAQGTTWLVTVSFSYAAGSPIANALNAPGVTFFTGTATCANDLASGSDVPEPSTWMLLSSGTGIGLLALRRRRRQK